jgi:nucleotide-binding universal stress UspA family protein
VNSAQQEASAKAAEQLNQLIALEGRKTDRTKIRVCIGKPYEQIIRVTLESQTDLVIMAVRGRSALDVAVFGSTTHRVVRLGPCPVLVVRLNH